MKVGAIILARLDSSRLPRKALRIIAGRPLIGYAVDLCRQVSRLDVIALATTTRAVDDPLAAFAAAEGIECIRGSTEDVAGRFLAALETLGLDAGLRLNGDSPLNRPALLGEAIATFRSGAWEMVSNVPGRSYPFGISVEVVALEAMRRAHASMIETADREHVTQYFYQHPERVRLHCMSSGSERYRGLQLAVDTEQDLARFIAIRQRLGARLWDASLAEVCELARDFDAQAAAPATH